MKTYKLVIGCMLAYALKGTTICTTGTCGTTTPTCTTGTCPGTTCEPAPVTNNVILGF